MSTIKSISYAVKGLATLASERNFKIHLVFAVLVLGAGYYFDISNTEWTTITICIAMVLMAEGFNTALELLCDRITKEEDAEIKKIKDASAASVLIMAMGTAVIGFVIFLPKII